MANGNDSGITDKRFSLPTLLVVSVLTSSGAGVGSSYFRVDKLGHSDFEKHKAALLIEFESKQRASQLRHDYELKLLEARIRRDMPPDEWRKSVDRMERFMAREHGYVPYER